MALILRVRPAVQKTQAVCITPTRELVLHQASIAQKLILHTAPAITVLCTEASADRCSYFNFLLAVYERVEQIKFVLELPVIQPSTDPCHQMTLIGIMW